MATLFEGKVSLAPVKRGATVFKLHPETDGKHVAANPQTIIDAIVNKKLTMSGWSLWFDGFDKEPAKGADVSPKLFAAYVKAADNVELVLVKRPFPQPKLKITKGAGSQRATAAEPKVRF